MTVRNALIAAFAVLAALAAAGLDAWRHPKPAALRADREAARVEVRRPREDLILTREAGGSWLVARQDDLADAEAVERLLSGLRALTFGPALGAADAAVASGLGPADSLRLRVLDDAGHALFDGEFGRRVFARSAYFRSRDGDPVRLATGLEPELLTRPATAWREPRLLPGGCADGLEVLTPGRPRAVPAAAARRLCALRAVRWADGNPEALAGFDRPWLKVRTPDGRGLTVGERRGADRLVRVDGRAALLRVSASALEAAAADLIGSKP